MPEQFFVVEAIDHGPDDPTVEYQLLTFSHQNLPDYDSLSSCVSPAGHSPQGGPAYLLLEAQFKKNSTTRTRVPQLPFQLHRQEDLKEVYRGLPSDWVPDHGPHMQTADISPCLSTGRNMGTPHRRIFQQLSGH